MESKLGRKVALTPEQGKRVAELRRAGLSLEVIAKRFGVSTSTIRLGALKFEKEVSCGSHE